MTAALDNAIAAPGRKRGDPIWRDLARTARGCVAFSAIIIAVMAIGWIMGASGMVDSINAWQIPPR